MRLSDGDGERHENVDVANEAALNSLEDDLVELKGWRPALHDAGHS